MRVITDYVRATSLPETLKEELAGSVVMQQHALYVHLPTWLAPLFPEVSAAQIEKLSLSSYFYFRFLLVIDNVLDAPAPAPDAAPHLATVRLLTYCDLFERSVRGLSDLFATSDPFWAQLDACKKQYAGSNQHEKKLSAARAAFSLEAFEALAADKSAVCNAVVYALASLGGTTAPVQDLLDCLKHVHVALQCMDDVEDFRTDWELGQYTYAHAQVEAYLAGEGLDPRVMTPAQVHPFLYTSGTADALFALGQQHFTRAIGLAKSLGLQELNELLVHHVLRCGVYRTDIAAKLEKARQRAESQVTTQAIAA